MAQQTFKRLYIVDPIKFNGAVESTMTAPEGLNPIYVDYSARLHNEDRNLTLPEYRKATNRPQLIALSWDEFVNQYYKPYLDSLQGDFKEITADQYNTSLECLPPQKWHDINSRFNSFYIMEAYTADLHSFYIKDRETGKYYTALRSKYISNEDLLRQLETI